MPKVLNMIKSLLKFYPPNGKLNNPQGTKMSNLKDDKQIKEKLTWLIDKRSQERYLTNKLLTKEHLKSKVDELPNLEELIEHFSDTLPQPALGQFDAETLARVQAAFPYRTIKSPHLD